MSSTRQILESHSAHLDESMGVRLLTSSRPQFSPIVQAKDRGREPLREFGTLDINQLIPEPKQPRVEFDDDELERLAQSIRDNGLLSPIKARWSDSHEKWIIVFGERRWRAAQRAGLKTIHCQFVETDLAPAEILEQQLIENCLRADLQPIEQAQAFAALMELHGWTGKELAAKLHIATGTVSRALALLRLPADVQQQVAAGKISARSGYELSKLESPVIQQRLGKEIAGNSLSHQQTARAVRKRKGRPPSQKVRGTRQTFIAENGWKVIVTANQKGNHYDIEAALTYALEEVRHRIEHGCQLF
jgi:ParB family chromosome partitioning protein